MWTDKDDLNIGTTVSPRDFIGMDARDLFCCIDGELGADDDANAMVGFNLTEPFEGADCRYTAQPSGPFNEGYVPTEDRLAVDISSVYLSPSISVVLQGISANGDNAPQWCQTLDLEGNLKSEYAFLPYDEFTTSCDADSTGEAYNGEPIASVVFRVEGDSNSATPYNICIRGFDEGEPPNIFD